MQIEAVIIILSYRGALVAAPLHSPDNCNDKSVSNVYGIVWSLICCISHLEAGRAVIDESKFGYHWMWPIILIRCNVCIQTSIQSEFIYLTQLKRYCAKCQCFLSLGMSSSFSSLTVFMFIFAVTIKGVVHWEFPSNNTNFIIPFYR